MKKIQNLEKKIESMIEKDRSFKERLNKLLKYSFSCFFIFGSLFAFAQIASLHIFTDGEIISAQKINENFAYLESKIATASGVGVDSLEVNSFLEYNISDNDNNKVFVVNNEVLRLYLPDLSTVTSGMSFKVSLNGKRADLQLIPSSGDGIEMMYDPNDIMDFYIMSGNTGYIEFIAAGDKWIYPVKSSSLSYTYYQLANIADTGCTGKLSGASNCYNDAVAQASGYAFIKNRIFSWDGTNWYTNGSTPYLLNDPNQYLQEEYGEYYLHYATIHNSSGTIITANSSSYSLSSIFSGFTNYLTHNTTDNDYINPLIDAYGYSTSGSYWHGSHCKSLFGDKWRMITESEAITHSTVSLTGVTHWTSSTGASPNSFLAMDTDAGGTEITDTSTTYYNFVCVYQPI